MPSLLRLPLCHMLDMGHRDTCVLLWVLDKPQGHFSGVVELIEDSWVTEEVTRYGIWVLRPFLFLSLFSDCMGLLCHAILPGCSVLPQVQSNRAK